MKISLTITNSQYRMIFILTEINSSQITKESEKFSFFVLISILQIYILKIYLFFFFLFNNKCFHTNLRFNSSKLRDFVTLNVSKNFNTSNLDFLYEFSRYSRWKQDCINRDGNEGLFEDSRCSLTKHA